MASSERNLSNYNKEEIPNAGSYKFGIVVSEYNEDITFSLRDACYDTLVQNGAVKENIDIIYVPGAFELTAGVDIMIRKAKYDAVICLGCVIKGETQHDEYIDHAVAQGLTNLTINSGIPAIFGLLTPNNKEQAIARAGGRHGNKGTEAAIAAIKMAHLYNS